MKSQKRKIVFVLLISGLCTTVLQSQMRNGKLGIGICGAGNILQSDQAKDQVGFGSSLELTYSLVNHWGIRSSLGFDAFRGKERETGFQFMSTAFHVNLAVSYNFLLTRAFSPFIFAGAGLMYYYPRSEENPGFIKPLLYGRDRPWDIALSGGLGFDIFFKEFLSITVSAEAGWLGSDNIDGICDGRGNDTFERISVGVRYYLFDKGFLKKTIKTIENRERSKTKKLLNPPKKLLNPRKKK